MKIIVGLGNPGRQYENTKHNIGFLTIDRLAEKHGIKVNRIKHKALLGEGHIEGEKVLLVKPQTYMNLSGESVREVLSYYKVDSQDMMVIYDDVDIEMGSFRIRAKGSAGSHNGMKSIIYNIVTDDFPRFRVGIGGDHKSDLADYVLGGFDKESAVKTRQAIDKVVEAIECAVSKGIDRAMNEYNIKPRTQKKQRQAEKRQAETSAGDSDDEVGMPGIQAAEAGAPGSQAAEAEAPGSQAAEAGTAGSRAAEAGAPGSRAAEAEAPGSQAAEAGAPGSRAAEAEAPGSRAAEAEAPGSRAAEAGAPGSPETTSAGRAEAPPETSQR